MPGGWRDRAVSVNALEADLSKGTWRDRAEPVEEAPRGDGRFAGATAAELGIEQPDTPEMLDDLFRVRPEDPEFTPLESFGVGLSRMIPGGPGLWKRAAGMADEDAPDAAATSPSEATRLREEAEKSRGDAAFRANPASSVLGNAVGIGTLDPTDISRTLTLEPVRGAVRVAAREGAERMSQRSSRLGGEASRLAGLEELDELRATRPYRTREARRQAEQAGEPTPRIDFPDYPGGPAAERVAREEFRPSLTRRAAAQVAQAGANWVRGGPISKRGQRVAGEAIADRILRTPTSEQLSRQAIRAGDWAARLRRLAPNEAEGIERALAESVPSGRTQVVAATLARKYPELREVIDEAATELRVPARKVDVATEPLGRRRPVEATMMPPGSLARERAARFGEASNPPSAPVTRGDTAPLRRAEPESLDPDALSPDEVTDRAETRRLQDAGELDARGRFADGRIERPDGTVEYPQRPERFGESRNPPEAPVDEEIGTRAGPSTPRSRQRQNDLDDATEAGERHARQGGDVGGNPYHMGSDEARAWERGHRTGSGDHPFTAERRAFADEVRARSDAPRARRAGGDDEAVAESREQGYEFDAENAPDWEIEERLGELRRQLDESYQQGHSDVPSDHRARLLNEIDDLQARLDGDGFDYDEANSVPGESWDADPDADELYEELTQERIEEIMRGAGDPPTDEEFAALTPEQRSARMSYELDNMPMRDLAERWVAAHERFDDVHANRLQRVFQSRLPQEQARIQRALENPGRTESSLRGVHAMRLQDELDELGRMQARGLQARMRSDARLRAQTQQAGPPTEDAVQDVVGRVMFDQGNVSEGAVESTSLGSRLPRGDERLRQLQGALEAARAEGRTAIAQRIEQIIAREFPRGTVRSDERVKQGVQPLDSKAILRRYVQVQAAKRAGGKNSGENPQNGKTVETPANPPEKRREAYAMKHEGGRLRSIEGAKRRITIVRDADGLPVSMELEEL